MRWKNDRHLCGGICADEEGGTISSYNYRGEKCEDIYVYSVNCLENTNGNNSNDKEAGSEVNEIGSEIWSLSGGNEWI